MQISDRAGVQLQLHSFLFSALDGVGRRRHALAALPRERESAHPVENAAWTTGSA